MDSIVSVFTELPSSSAKRNDDFVDRLNSRYSVVVLVAFSILVSLHQIVGTPIACFTEQHFTGNHVKYANSYCWITNTYYLDFDEYIPKPHEDDKRQTIPYYQWVPFILLGQAVLFYMPSILWHSFNTVSGVDADNIVSAAHTFNKLEDEEKRTSTLMLIRNQMDRFLSSRVGVGKGNVRDKLARRQYCGRRFSAYLSILYILTKALYVANAIAQLFLLGKCLGTNYSLYGYHVMRWMINDHDWINSPFIAFPRVTMCDFDVRRLGNIHRYTMQCALPINLYNEKIFMFLWFWITAVAAMSIFSLITWTMRATSQADRSNYIHGHLKWLKHLDHAEDREKAQDFTQKYLREDGIFLLRLIGHNTNTLTVSEIIGTLWDGWLDKKRNKSNNPDHAPAMLPKPSQPVAIIDYPTKPLEKPPLAVYPTLPLSEKLPLPE